MNEPETYTFQIYLLNSYGTICWRMKVENVLNGAQAIAVASEQLEVPTENIVASKSFLHGERVRD